MQPPEPLKGTAQRIHDRGGESKLKDKMDRSSKPRFLVDSCFAAPTTEASAPHPPRSLSAILLAQVKPRKDK